MTNLVKATAYNADMLEAIFAMNKWEETEITCPDGTEVVVKPCYYGEGMATRDEVEYYLVYGDMPYMGCDTLEKLANELNEHAKNLEKAEAEKKELREFFDKHEANGWTSDSWDSYSDWHKDLYGYRPHGHVCGTFTHNGAYFEGLLPRDFNG